MNDLNLYQKDSVLVPIAKVATYGMGKVPMYPESELQQLQQMKQILQRSAKYVAICAAMLTTAHSPIQVHAQWTLQIH